VEGVRGGAFGCAFAGPAGWHICAMGFLGQQAQAAHPLN